MPEGRVAFLLARLDEERDETKRSIDLAARHLVILETVRQAVDEAQATLDDEDGVEEAIWLAEATLGAFVVAWQEHPDFQPGWMSD